MAKLVSETHNILAGSDFDGTTPLSDSDEKSGDLVYAGYTAGGLFSCPIARNDTTHALTTALATLKVRILRSLRITFGSQTSWTINITDGTREQLWLSGTTDSDLLWTADGHGLELLPNEYLKLETTGASAAMQATLTYDVRDA